MTNADAKTHATHTVFHPTCTFCVTEKRLGHRPNLRPYDAPILNVVKGSK